VVIDSERRAVFQDYTPRAFDLHREQVGRIFEPTYLEFFAIEGAGLNGRPVVIRDELPPPVAATDPRMPIWKRVGSRLSASYEQVRRAAVNRYMKFLIRKARALNDRLKVTGYKPLGLT